MKGYYKLRKKAFEILTTELPENYYYHGIQHSLDTLKVCNQYIRREKINKYHSKILRIAVLFHDIGFTISNENHESNSVKIVTNQMRMYHFKETDIALVCSLIRATKMPQEPTSILEAIICDADLDYLGRPDFYSISNLLYKELKSFSKIETKNEWNLMQIQFLESHNYHTNFAKKNRQPAVDLRIRELKKMISS